MTPTTQLDVESRVLDITARGIDLLAVIAKISSGSESASALIKEVGRWLGKEGLDEVELEFFLKSTRALVRPNTQREVNSFFQAVMDRRPKISVVPLWAQPSGGLGRLVASDPLQRWLTTTICCLFRYHDERFIELVLASLIMLASRPRQKPLSEYQLIYDPEMLRLEPVVSKVIHSNWIHIANSGIIGSDSECPRLPTELSWTCKKGHNIGSYKLALALSRLCDPPKEIIFQSDRLLTNLVLWLTWHFNGRLRIVVSGSVVYDKSLGQADSTVECRVSRFCSNDGDGTKCTSSGTDPAPFFEMSENIEGGVKSFFRGQYDNLQTSASEPRVRQKLYQSPIRYPRGVQKSLEIQAQRTAQELLRWFCGLPIKEYDTGSRLSFRLLLNGSGGPGWSGLRVTDLLGRTPKLLTTYCGELGRPFVVFSPPTVGGLMDSDEDEEMEYGDEEDDGEVAPEDKPRVLIKYFPILRDLVEQARLACRCFYCSREKGQQTFMWDENCLESQAFMEVMFYFSQGIADAFGAPDVSGYSQGRAVDAATIDILFEAIESVRFNPSNLEGRIEWHTLLNTACQIFLGCDQLDSMTDTINHNDTPDTPEPNITKSLGTTIIAVQHGNLAVVAPWLDLSQKIELRRCFRWQVVQGRLSLPVGEVSGKIILQEVAHDTSVIETQHTEDVSDYAEMFKMPTYPAGAEIQLTKDNSDESCDFVLVSAAGKMSHKLLMRVTSEAHSRMVDPSRTIIKMARGIHALQCKHDKSKTGSVPEDRTVEMYRFDELLGRWGALEGREGDPEEQRDLSSSMESLASPPTLTTDGGKSAKSSQPSKSLRVTHILNSSFKFNTALALSEDNPAFVGSGNVCLDCALGKAIGFELQDLNKDYSRWIINHDPHLSNKVPRNRFQLTQSQPRLIAHDKPSVVRNPSNLSPILRRA